MWRPGLYTFIGLSVHFLYALRDLYVNLDAWEIAIVTIMHDTPLQAGQESTSRCGIRTSLDATSCMVMDSATSLPHQACMRSSATHGDPQGPSWRRCHSTSWVGDLSWKMQTWFTVALTGIAYTPSPWAKFISDLASFWETLTSLELNADVVDSDSTGIMVAPFLKVCSLIHQQR